MLSERDRLLHVVLLGPNEELLIHPVLKCGVSRHTSLTISRLARSLRFSCKVFGVATHAYELVSCSSTDRDSVIF